MSRRAALGTHALWAVKLPAQRLLRLFYSFKPLIAHNKKYLIAASNANITKGRVRTLSIISKLILKLLS